MQVHRVLQVQSVQPEPRVFLENPASQAAPDILDGQDFKELQDHQDDQDHEDLQAVEV